MLLPFSLSLFGTIVCGRCRKTSKVGGKIYFRAVSDSSGIQISACVCVSYWNTRRKLVAKLTQHCAHVRVRRVEVDGAVRVLERRVLAEQAPLSNQA